MRESDSPGRVGFAEAVLFVVTIVWGCSFVLTKGAGEQINAAAGVEKGALGPVLILAIRFTLAAILWALLFPRGLRGWSPTNAKGASIVGVLLTFGLILQCIGLDHTIEAVSAFLTSLAVVFVPLLIWLLYRQRPGLAAFVGIALAVPGVWLMNDVRGLTLGLGETLGVGCSFVFAWHLIAINHYTPRDSPWRMTLAQFAMVAGICWVGAGVLLMQATTFDWSVLMSWEIWWRMIVLVIGPTILCFGAMTHFQPRVPPVRAVLIYLFEPVWAGIFAYLLEGRTLTSSMMIGGGLILLANVIVEVLPARATRKPAGTSDVR
jgi:drug/metabolite transporter (DMT)-like permease